MLRQDILGIPFHISPVPLYSLPWMYIPQIHSLFPDPPEGELGAGQSFIYHHLSELSDNSVLFLIRQFLACVPNALSAVIDRAPGLQKRDSASQVNTTIGVTVAILLAVFLVAFFSFLHVYRHSIRFTSRKKRRHRKSVGSGNLDSAGGQGEAPAG
ncbi:hypothetical protein F5X99DRAFT_375761 [Biscogniauxia marginata]|nr:hypothetical protein F5X99DRAFT_375761 [Biscogniauxia marginata]